MIIITHELFYPTNEDPKLAKFLFKIPTPSEKGSKTDSTYASIINRIRVENKKDDKQFGFYDHDVYSHAAHHTLTSARQCKRKIQSSKSLNANIITLVMHLITFTSFTMPQLCSVYFNLDPFQFPYTIQLCICQCSMCREPLVHVWFHSEYKHGHTMRCMHIIANRLAPNANSNGENKPKTKKKNQTELKCYYTQWHMH